jgi:tetratricopeptide (TPR) repeat protein
MSEASIPTAEECLSLADCYYINEDFDLALDAYAAAESTARHDCIRFRSLSHKSAALIQLGRYEEAQASATAALEACSAGLRHGETEACQKRLGQTLFQLGRYQEALTALEQASQLALLNQRNASKYEALIQQCKEKIAGLTPSATVPPPPPASIAPPVSSSRPIFTKPMQPTMPKYQYYQNETFMKIELLEHSVKQEDLRVDILPRKLTVILKKQGVEFTVIHGILYDKVDVARSKVLVKDEKVLIKLRKLEPHDWHELFGKKNDEDEETKVPDTEVIPTTTEKVRPYASTRDWSAIERNLEKVEESETPQGDDAMSKLFQKIYSGASEDTRRAMIKSYQTSGGTVLSTNWDEVKEKDYEGKDRVAPKGQEWKDWEGKKLPQKD